RRCMQRFGILVCRVASNTIHQVSHLFLALPPLFYFRHRPSVFIPPSGVWA
ncbi:hypothetical protein L9F63_008548, partial [Diploptera punctata]